MKIMLRFAKPVTVDDVAGELVRQVARTVLGAEEARLEPELELTLRKETGELLARVAPEDDSMRHWQRLVAELGILLGARLESLVGPEREVLLYAVDLPTAITAALEPYLESKVPPPAEPEAAPRRGLLAGLLTARSAFMAGPAAT